MTPHTTVILQLKLVCIKCTKTYGKKTIYTKKLGHIFSGTVGYTKKDLSEIVSGYFFFLFYFLHVQIQLDCFFFFFLKLKYTFLIGQKINI